MKKIFILLIFISSLRISAQNIHFMGQTKQYILSQLEAKWYVEDNTSDYLIVSSGDKKSVYLFSKDGLCIVIAYDIDEDSKQAFIAQLLKDGLKQASPITMSAPGDFTNNAKEFPAERYYNDKLVYSFFNVSVMGKIGSNCVAVIKHQ
jgi:hypothetical protein